MIYPLTHNSWNKSEIQAIKNVIKSGMYSMSNNVKRFEKQLANFFNAKDAVMVNSGSSANLLIFALLKYKYNLKGDVLVPVVGWSTSYFPIHQNGFRLVFVDINPNTFNIDDNLIEKNITKNTCAILAINILGNTCNFKNINKIAKKHNLILIEDNCESFGAISNNKKLAGTNGLMGSLSFFFSHHLQTMEGGAILCKKKSDATYLRSLRAHGWRRDDESFFDIKNPIKKFKNSFKFYTPGYNLRPLEMSGAIGSVQLKKWNHFHSMRLQNAQLFKEIFGQNKNIIIQKELGVSSWFGFGFILQGKLKGKRDIIIKKFYTNQIECRPIVTGNFLKNPVIKLLNHKKSGKFINADNLHNNGLFLGNHSKNLSKQIQLAYKLISEI